MASLKTPLQCPLRGISEYLGERFNAQQRTMNLKQMASHQLEARFLVDCTSRSCRPGSRLW